MTEAKRGRPPKVEGAKRSAIAVRTTEEVKERITAAAEEAGRSLTQEIEQRLEWSLQFETLVGGPASVAFFQSCGDIFVAAQERTGKPWNKDTETWEAVKRGVAHRFDGWRPVPENAAQIMTAKAEADRAEAEYVRAVEAYKARFPYVGEEPLTSHLLDPRNALLGYSVPPYRSPRMARDEAERAEMQAEWDKLLAALNANNEAQERLNDAFAEWDAARERGKTLADEILAIDLANERARR